jgi:hypothetical protein
MIRRMEKFALAVIEVSLLIATSSARPVPGVRRSYAGAEAVLNHHARYDDRLAVDESAIQRCRCAQQTEPPAGVRHKD